MIKKRIRWPRAILVWLLPLFLSVAVFVAAVPAQAQAPVQAPASEEKSDVTADDLKSLVSTIEDPAAREELLGQLKALIAAQEKEKQKARPGLAERIGDRMANQFRHASEEMVAAAAVLGDIPKMWAWLKVQATDPDRRAVWGAVVGQLLMVMLVGLLAEWLIRMALGRPRAAVEARGDVSLLVRTPFLFVRTLIDLVPVAAFAITVYIIQYAVPWAPGALNIVLAVVSAYLTIRIVMVFARMLLAPAVPGLRVFPLDDETANYLFIWTRRFICLTVAGYFLVEAAGHIGLPEGAQGASLKLLGLVVAVMAVIFILQNRRNFADLIRGDNLALSGAGIGILRRRCADIWHVLAILYVLAVALVWIFSVEDGFRFVFQATLLSVIIVIAATLIISALGQTIERLFAIRSEVRAQFPTLEARANRYLPILHVVVRVVVWGLAFLAVLEAWGLDVLTWLTGPGGQRVLGSAFSIFLIVILALVLWEAASSSIERYLNKTDADGNLIQRGTRARTLLPILRNAIFIVLAVLVALIVLAELGVNIAPLLAGAGVIGLALGFGSQKLVQDVITGAFILFEDAVSVGDVVQVGGKGGVVEAVTVRSIRLRDLSGSVHTIPFSSVDTVTNMTKVFSFYVFEVGVAYRESVDEVMDVLRQIGAELQEDDEYGPLILEPLDVLGVDAFGDSAVIVKARLKTQPVKQWMVGREFNRRMKNRFDELGIEIPFPHRTLYFGVDKEGSAPPAFVAMSDPDGGGTPKES